MSRVFSCHEYALKNCVIAESQLAVASLRPVFILGLTASPFTCQSLGVTCWACDSYLYTLCNKIDRFFIGLQAVCSPPSLVKERLWGQGLVSLRGVPLWS